MKAPGMMPGQKPYTDDELKRLRALVRDAAVADEMFDRDELEDAAREYEARRQEAHGSKPGR